MKIALLIFILLINEINDNNKIYHEKYCAIIDTYKQNAKERDDENDNRQKQ
ncbi:hypothetical protein [Inconstantimicrobium mannanitabidum]|uniref:Uncharacterized protein n=1 Tax=Inconstantimicrobium mannanitabidum TaxID=1604901 RepID=A0ACB5RAI2_9CLOT|nr:hypothetical protein [Clostridium sp. TW13]GKX66051.1 hypothetical protein rsdtw13_13090 [Clostridium sp. TW13]